MIILMRSGGVVVGRLTPNQNFLVSNAESGGNKMGLSS